MKPYLRILFLPSLLCLLFKPSLSQLKIDAYNQIQQSPPRVEIPGSQRLSISSTVVGREYELYVQLPRWYEDTSRTFPVVYVLDGQWDFTLVGSLYGQQHYDGFVPGLIIVAITWGGKSPNHDSLRAADLTPTNNKGLPQSGNAPKFLSFMKYEALSFHRIEIPGPP